MTDLHCPLCGSPEIVWKSKVLLWECNACQERFPAPPPDVEQASDPLVNQERALLSRAQALASHGDWQDRIRTAWPAPIAFTYQLLRTLLKNGQIDAAAWVLKDLGELMARFPALVMARDILESGAPGQQQMVRQRLFGKPMAMGDWIRLADDLAREIQTHPESFMVPKIATLFRQGKQRQVLPGFLEALVTWRNETLGHGVRGEDAESTLKDLEGFLGQLPAGNAPKNLHSVLLGVADLWTDLDLKDPEGHSLIGAEAFRPEHSSSGEHHLGPVVPLILQSHSDDSRQLRLAPYIAVRRCAVCEQQETFHYDSIKDQRLVPDFRVLNYERGHATRIAVDQDPEMLADYNQGKPAERGAEGDFSGDALDARVAALLDEISIERSYLSPQYLRDPLKVWIESRRDQGVGATFWLRAPAHVGKSTFVRGLDPRYRNRFRESPLIDDLAVVVFYVRREYQYHIAQFADTLRDLLRDELNLRAQNQLLPSLDLEDSHRTGALTHFLEAYQRLGNRPILIVVDGLDELGREDPGIADYLGGQPPENVFILLTSRPVVDLAPWQRDKLTPLIQQIENPAQGQNGDPALVVRDIGLQDQDYNALMDAYAERYGKGKVTPEIREMIKEKSDGRFLYFAFLVSRVADGGLKKEDLAQLQDPATLVPGFVQSLLGRYQDSPLGDLIQRTLLHLVAAENAYIAHNQNVPPLFQQSWNGLPMEVLCLLVEGNQEPTTRFVQVLYLLKPLLGTWRGADSGAFYRLGIKGLREDLAQNYAPDITRLQDHSVRQVLEHMEALDQSAPETLLSKLPADQEWTAEFLNGRLNEASEILWEETVLRHFSALNSLLFSLFARAIQKQEQGFYRDAMQRYSVYIAVLEILRPRLGEQFPPDMTNSLADAYTNRGVTLKSGGDLQEALADYGRSIAIWEALRTRLGEQFPPDMANRLAGAYMGRGNTLNSGGDLQGALADYGQAIDIWESLRPRLGEQFPPDMTDGLASAYVNRGNTLNSGGDLQGALADYGQAIAIIEESLRIRLGEQFPPNMASGLAGAYMNRGITLDSGGDLQGALADYGRAIAIREAMRTRLGEQFPPDMAEGLASAYMNRGVTLKSGGDLQGALADYGQAIDIWESLRTRLGEQFPPDMTEGLAGAYMNRGVTLKSGGDLQGALADYGQAITILENIHKRLGDHFTLEMANHLSAAKVLCREAESGK